MNLIALMILTERQVQWRGLYGLQFPNSVLYQEHCGQTPCDVNIQVAMHKPGTYNTYISQ